MPERSDGSISGESIREAHVRTDRSARVALVGGDAAGCRAAWYLLHGYGQLADRFIARFTGIATTDRALVAPEGLSRFYLRPAEENPERARAVGASWMTREDRLHEIDDYVRYLDRVAEEVEGPGERAIDRTVLGFSQGVHTAARWVVMGRTPVSRLILWGASLPLDLPDDAPSILRKVAVVLVRGANDPLRRTVDEVRDEAWLADEQIPFDVRTHGGAHEIDGELLRALADG